MTTILWFGIFQYWQWPLGPIRLLTITVWTNCWQWGARIRINPFGRLKQTICVHLLQTALSTNDIICRIIHTRQRRLCLQYVRILWYNSYLFHTFRQCTIASKMFPALNKLIFGAGGGCLMVICIQQSGLFWLLFADKKIFLKGVSKWEHEKVMKL